MTTIPAPPRSTTGIWNAELMIWQDRPEPHSRWMARALLEARATSPKPLDNLQMVVSTEAYVALMQEIRGDFHVDGVLSQVYGAELVVDHDLAVPFEVRWESWEDRAVRRLREGLL